MVFEGRIIDWMETAELEEQSVLISTFQHESLFPFDPHSLLSVLSWRYRPAPLCFQNILGKVADCIETKPNSFWPHGSFILVRRKLVLFVTSSKSYGITWSSLFGTVPTRAPFSVFIWYFTCFTISSVKQSNIKWICVKTCLLGLNLGSSTYWQFCHNSHYQACCGVCWNDHT